MAKHQNGPCHQVWRRWQILMSFVHRCYLQSLAQIAEMALEKLENVRFSFLAILWIEIYCKSWRGLHHTMQLN